MWGRQAVLDGTGSTDAPPRQEPQGRWLQRVRRTGKLAAELGAEEAAGERGGVEADCGGGEGHMRWP